MKSQSAKPKKRKGRRASDVKRVLSRKELDTIMRSPAPRWKPVCVDLSTQARQLVCKMLATGMYGLSFEDVCQRLLLEKLREFDVRRRGGREVVLRRLPTERPTR